MAECTLKSFRVDCDADAPPSRRLGALGPACFTCFSSSVLVASAGLSSCAVIALMQQKQKQTQSEPLLVS